MPFDWPKDDAVKRARGPLSDVTKAPRIFPVKIEKLFVLFPRKRSPAQGRRVLQREVSRQVTDVSKRVFSETRFR